MSGVDELDPSLADGFSLFYERECPFELRVRSKSDERPEVGNLEGIIVRILIKEDSQGMQGVRIELSSENDLFFHYMHFTSADTFRKIHDPQRLMVDFPEYPQMLKKMVQNCYQMPHSHLAVFVMQRDGTASLNFIQNMEYKFIELFSASFIHSPEQLVRQQICYRYNTLQAKLRQMQSRMDELTTAVKVKNPALMQSLDKSTRRQSPARGSGGERHSASGGSRATPRALTSSVSSVAHPQPFTTSFTGSYSRR